MTEGVVKCPKCGAHNRSSLDFCGACGADLGAASTEDRVADPWDRVLGRTAKDLEAKTEIPENKPRSRSDALLRFIIGPAVTVSALVLVVGTVWLRVLSTNVQVTEDYLHDLNLAGDMSSYGLVAFAILVVVALSLLSMERER